MSFLSENFQVRETLKGFILTDDNLKHISNLFLEEVKKGLARRTHDSASVKCYVTYVQDLPKGTGYKKTMFLIFVQSVTLFFF